MIRPLLKFLFKSIPFSRAYRVELTHARIYAKSKSMLDQMMSVIVFLEVLIFSTGLQGAFGLTEVYLDYY